jgi:hypothetical protein
MKRKAPKNVEQKSYEHEDIPPCSGCGKEPMLTCDKCNAWRCEECLDIYLGEKVADSHFICKPACPAGEKDDGKTELVPEQV